MNNKDYYIIIIICIPNDFFRTRLSLSADKNIF